jgi:NTP pyrophosphatase (non-canonical NTP hydrolase)
MKLKDYKEQSERTESKTYYFNRITESTLHGVIGIITEAGELLDAIKKGIFYGQVIDKENIKEELGDIMWYIAILLREFDWDMKDILSDNIDKLKKRYPEKFTTENSKLRLDKKSFKKEIENEKV